MRIFLSFIAFLSFFGHASTSQTSYSSNKYRELVSVLIFDLGALQESYNICDKKSYFNKWKNNINKVIYFDHPVYVNTQSLKRFFNNGKNIIKHQYASCSVDLDYEKLKLQKSALNTSIKLSSMYNNILQNQSY